MANFTKETVTTMSNGDSQKTPTLPNASNLQTIEYLVYFFFGILEMILAARFIFRLLGASTSSGFIRTIYSIGGLFIMPFEGIFRRGTAPGIETAAVFEPSTLVAIAFYLFLSWGIVKLMYISSGKQQSTE